MLSECVVSGLAPLPPESDLIRVAREGEADVQRSAGAKPLRRIIRAHLALCAQAEAPMSPEDVRAMLGVEP